MPVIFWLHEDQEWFFTRGETNEGIRRVQYWRPLTEQRIGFERVGLVVQKLEVQGACTNHQRVQSAGRQGLRRTVLKGSQMGWKQDV